MNIINRIRLALESAVTEWSKPAPAPKGQRTGEPVRDWEEFQKTFRSKGRGEP